MAREAGTCCRSRTVAWFSLLDTRGVVCHVLFHDQLEVAPTGEAPQRRWPPSVTWPLRHVMSQFNTYCTCFPDRSRYAPGLPVGQNVHFSGWSHAGPALKVLRLELGNLRKDPMSMRASWPFMMSCPRAGCFLLGMGRKKNAILEDRTADPQIHKTHALRA